MADSNSFKIAREFTHLLSNLKETKGLATIFVYRSSYIAELSDFFIIILKTELIYSLFFPSK